MNELNKNYIHVDGCSKDELKILQKNIKEITMNIDSLSPLKKSFIKNIIFTSIKDEVVRRVVNFIDQRNFKF